jgi:hypothetical protein
MTPSGPCDVPATCPIGRSPAVSHGYSRPPAPLFRSGQVSKLTCWMFHRSGCGRASISCQDAPEKPKCRSLTNSPCVGKLLARERGRVIARSGISSDSLAGYASPDLPPQPPEFGFQRIQFGTGDTDHLGYLDAHMQLPWFGACPKSRRMDTSSTAMQAAQTGRRRARCVPDGTANRGTSQVLTATDP